MDGSRLKLFGKRREIKRLADMMQSGRMPHGIMLVGDKGMGKRTLAKWCAMLMLCEKPILSDDNTLQPCMECISCRKIASGEHPDVVYADEEIYKVGEMRRLVEKLSLFPNDGDVRVTVFEDCDKMSVLCQNILLKAIEEPSVHNRFIFTCPNKSAVLTTILSRLVSIPMSDMTADECAGCLEYCGVENDKAVEYTEKFGTNCGKIMELLHNESELSLYDTADRICAAIADFNEYNAAKEFFTLADRESLFGVIGILYEKTAAAAIPTASADPASVQLKAAVPLKKLYRLTQKLSDIMQLDGSNVNVKLMQAVVPAQLFDILL